MLRRWLEHPLTRGRPLDDPRTTALRRDVVRSKPLLRDVYREWYRLIGAVIPVGRGAVLELGSGAGFLREVIPDAVASELFPCPGAQVVLDGQRLAVRTGALRAIVMVDVLHHLPECRRFFAEAARCVRPGGVVAAIEPWVSPWSRLVYGRFHHEPFRPDAAAWEFPSAGPLSSANQALPWILFQRDRAAFEREFPQWRIARVSPLAGARYLASGGVGLRSLAPGWSAGALRMVERWLAPWASGLALFAHVVLERTASAADARMPT